MTKRWALLCNFESNSIFFSAVVVACIRYGETGSCSCTHICIEAKEANDDDDDDEGREGELNKHVKTLEKGKLQ